MMGNDFNIEVNGWKIPLKDIDVTVSYVDERKVERHVIVIKPYPHYIDLPGVEQVPAGFKIEVSGETAEYIREEIAKRDRPWYTFLPPETPK